MALEVYFADDIYQTVLAGVVLAVEMASAQGMANVDVVRGALLMARHQALSFGICWPELIANAQDTLGKGENRLIEQAMRQLGTNG